MNQERVAEVVENDKYRRLTAERRRLSTGLSAVVVAAYFSYILCIGFWPHLLATRLTDGTVITVGLAAAVGLILLGFALTAVYVRRANTTFDSLSNAIREDLR